VPEGLRAPDVPDPGHEALVEKRLPDRAVPVGAAQIRSHQSEIGRGREDVGPESGDAARAELQHGAIPQHGFAFAPAEHEPGPSTAGTAAWEHLPATAHSQVAPQDEIALELQQEVLPHRVHSLEPAPVEPGGYARGGAAWVRRFDLDALADEGSQARGRPVE
jgi:hypothetical protein